MKIRVAIPFLSFLLFVAIAALVVKTAKQPEPEQRVDLGALVEVVEVRRDAHRIDVQAQGTVLPARRVVVQPQVAGRVEWIAEAFQPGGRFSAGAPLFRIEQADYELAVATARSALAEAEAQLALEQGRGRVAEREWELFRDELDDEQREAALALRQPQLQSARAAVAAAQSRLRRAELDLERTTVRAPWNALVLDESLDVGQTVGIQSVVATLVGSDVFWVRAAVPVDQLAAVDLEAGGDRPGTSRAWVRADGGQSAAPRTGRVLRLLGDVEPAGRLARVLIEVPDPLDAPQGGGDPADRLLLDAYVDVTIEGAEERQLFELSRNWLQDGNSVWLFRDGTLDVRQIDVA